MALILSIKHNNRANRGWKRGVQGQESEGNGGGVHQYCEKEDREEMRNAVGYWTSEKSGGGGGD